MSDQQPPEEPFDPYRPPPPGQQQPQQWGQQPGHPQSYGEPFPTERRSAKPLWIGALIGILLVAAGIWATASAPDLGPYLFWGLVLVTVILLVVPVTRRWGLGILIGAALSIPVGLIIFAGLCIVLIMANSGGGT